MIRCKHVLLWLLALALLGIGCETVVDVPPPAHEPQLVAQSFFSADGGWTVQVTRTVPYASAASPTYVDDATVEVWDGDRRISTPQRADSGTYVAQGNGATQGSTYTLRVEAPGYPPVEGHSTLPPPPVVTVFHETLVPPADSLSRRRITQVDLTLTDSPGVRNRYGLLVVQARWSEDRATGQRTPLPPSLFTFESNDPALGESDFDFLNTGTTRYREAFFTDGLFDGSTYTLDFDLQYDLPRDEAEVVIRRVFVVVLLSVTDDFYQYRKTASEQSVVNENPFAEPLRVHSNMTGGFGVFAGFQYRIFALQASDVGLGGTTLADLCQLVDSQLPICVGRSGAS